MPCHAATGMNLPCDICMLMPFVVAIGAQTVPLVNLI